MAKKLKPVHPGEILREDFMKPLKLSMNRLALDLHISVTRIAEILAERRGISADTAIRLARYFGNAPAFWMNLQTRYDLEVAEDEIAAKVARDVRPHELMVHAWCENGKEKAAGSRPAAERRSLWTRLKRLHRRPPLVLILT